MYLISVIQHLNKVITSALSSRTRPTCTADLNYAYILVMGVPEWKENGAEQIILKKKSAKSQI